MAKYAQIVMGPAGVGKSTYCDLIVKHHALFNRKTLVINMDPAAERFKYPVFADIRDVISVSDVLNKSSLNLGPNGSLMLCFEFIVHQPQWFESYLKNERDIYVLFDMPGQIELYTHMDFLNRFGVLLQKLDFRICCVFLLDCHFVTDPFKLIAGTLTAVSALLNSELPHIGLITKVNLMSEENKAQLESILDNIGLNDFEEDFAGKIAPDYYSARRYSEKFNEFKIAINKLLKNSQWIDFKMLDASDDENVQGICASVDLLLDFFDDQEIPSNVNGELSDV